MSAGLSAGAIAGIVGGVASVGSSIISANGAQSAANTQASAQEQAAQIQQQEFNTITQQEQPFITAGTNATTTLQQLLGLTPGGGSGNGYLINGAANTPAFSFDPSSITKSPGYQFAQNQGMQQIQNSASATTGALSGSALKALTNFSTGTAEQYYNDYFNQALNQYTTNFNTQQTAQNNVFNRLSAIAGLGQNAATQTGNAGSQLATGTAQAVAGAGASQAAGTVGAANAASGGLSGLGNSIALSSILNANGASNGDYGVPGWSPATGGN